MAETENAVAFLKQRPTSSVPIRPAVLQTAECCTTCIKWSEEQDSAKNPDARIDRFQCYDNLCFRFQKQNLMFRYGSSQYHQGHVDMLKISVENEPEIDTLYLISCHLARDISLLDWVLKFAELRKPFVYVPGQKSNWPIVATLQRDKAVAVPVRISDCCVEDEYHYDKKEEICWELDQIPKLIKQIVDHRKVNPDYNVRIVSVIVSKDHDRSSLVCTGSTCTHIMQPYYFDQFTQSHTESLEYSITQHFAYDTAKNAPILSASLVAFIILYYGEDAVKIKDLVRMVDWFIKSSTMHTMQLAFTGDNPQCVVSYSLYLLEDFIVIDKVGDTIKPKHSEKLKSQADVVVPKIIRFGIIGRAVIMAHNAVVSECNSSVLKPNMRAPQQRVINTAKKLVERLETKIPIRPPCESVDDVVYSTFNLMCDFCGYFKVYDPKAIKTARSAWTGDENSDSEYEMDYEDHPLHQAWVQVTARDYRLERLNMCVNAIEDYVQMGPNDSRKQKNPPTNSYIMKLLNRQ